MAEHRIISSLMRPFFRKGRTASFTVPGGITNSSRILCIDPGDLSQILFHVPLIKALRRRFPEARIDFLIPEKHAPLIVPSGLAKECIIYKEGQLNPWRPAFSSLLRKISNCDYDMAMVMSFTPRPRLELVALASGASLRFGPSHTDSWPAVNFEILPPGDADTYLGDRLYCAAPFLGLQADDLDVRWPLPMEQIRQMAQQIHFHKPNPDQMLIGVDPGVSKNGHSFSLDNLQFLVRQLTSQLVCRVLPIGHPDEKEKIKKLESRLSEVPVGLKRESLLEMTLLLSQCDLFLAANTDFFHFAVSLGVPTVGLFTPSDQGHWVPQDRDLVRVLHIAKGEKVDIESLMEAVEQVTHGRTSKPSKIIAASADDLIDDSTSISTGQETDDEL